MPIKKYSDAVQLLWSWQHGGDSFTCNLFSLYAKADQTNKLSLESIFPIETIVYNDWFNYNDSNEFFKKYLK